VQVSFAHVLMSCSLLPTFGMTATMHNGYHYNGILIDQIIYPKRKSMDQSSSSLQSHLWQCDL
jgi:hypothetical protein